MSKHNRHFPKNNSNQTDASDVPVEDMVEDTPVEETLVEDTSLDMLSEENDIPLMEEESVSEIDSPAPLDLNSIPSPADEGQVVFVGMKKAELEKLLDDKSISNPSSFRVAVNSPGTWENMACTQFLLTTEEVIRQEEFLEQHITDKSQFTGGLKNPETGKYKLAPQNVKPPQIKPGAIVPSGTEGLRLILFANGKNVRRIPLYASGFTIDIYPPSARQLSDFHRRIDHTKQQFGAATGFPVFYFMDYIIKSEFMTLLKEITVHSTLPGWQEPQALINNISFADYPALLTHVAAVMFPEGFDGFRHACTRPVDEEHPQGCNHVIKAKIDILKIIRTRFSMLSELCVAHMQKCNLPAANITLEEIQGYKDSLTHSKTVLSYKDLEFVLKDVSMAEHLEAASTFTAELQSTLKEPDEETLFRYLDPRSVLMLHPYIESIRLVNQKATIVDRQQIKKTLETASDHPDFQEVIKKMIEFISSLQLTYPAYPKFTCPVCGYLPDSPKGFNVVDPQILFFIISSRIFQKLM